MPRLASVCRALGLAAGAGFATLLLVSSMISPSVGLALKATIGGIFAVTLLDPALGLLAVAGAVPFAQLLTPGVSVPPLRVAEAVTLAFLSAFCVDLLLSRGGRDRLLLPVSLFAFVVLASAVVEIAALQPAVDSADRFLRRLWIFVSSRYLLPTGEFLNLTAAMLLIEGAGLLAATLILNKRDQRLPGRLLGIAAGAGFLVASLALGRLASEALEGLERWPRLSAQVADLNAAGSYLVLVMPAACLFAARRSTAAAIAVGSWFAAAIWLTGSRTAAAVLLLVGLALLVRAAAPDLLASRRRKMAALAGAAVALGLSAVIASALVVRSDPNAPRWLDIRLGFTQTSLGMIRSSPAFGIGVGNYYPMSGRFMPEALNRIYPLENAHNNFLQIAAELGITGGLLFALTVAGVLMRAVKHLGGSADADTVLAGATIGTCAYLLTCLAGHPLLVYETAYPFWLVMGCAAAARPTAWTAERAPDTDRIAWSTPLTAVLFFMIFVSIPGRITSAGDRTDLSNVTYGLGRIEKDERDGRLFRRSAGRATLFIRSDAQAVDLPVRLVNVSPKASAELLLMLDSRPANKVRIDDEWTTIDVRMPRSSNRFRRLDLEVACDPMICPGDGLGAMAVGEMGVR
jgi:O-antigen ligase